MSSFAELQERAYADLWRPKPLPAPDPSPAPTGAAASPSAAPAPSLAKPAASAHTPPPPEVKVSVTQASDDDAKRKIHEATEAQRRAEFDAKQAAKETARQEQLDRIAAMSDEDAVADAVRRIGEGTEKLTRRNMKEAVCEHIQALCRQHAAFARHAIAPGKSMINCFQYIYRMAQAYVEQEMEDNGIQRTGIYGLDVPDGLCYQWAEDYFNDPDAKEDHKNDGKFVPQPYVPTGRKTSQNKAAQKKPAPQKAGSEKPSNGGMEQLTLGRCKC